jgi:competence protein ComEC
LNAILQPSGLVTLPRVVAFVAGVIAIQQFPSLPDFPSLGLLGLAFGVLLHLRLHGPAAFVFGLLWAIGFASLRLGETLPGTSERLPALVEGVVLDLPQSLDRGVRFDFGIERVLESDGLKLPGRVRLSGHDPTLAPKAGERWRFRISLRRPHGLANPGGFDYEQWLFAHGIRAVGYVRNSRHNQRLAEGSSWSVAVWRQHLYDRLSDTLANHSKAGLIKALTLGADDDIPQEQWEVLRRTGTAHLIAISGSHIGLIAAFVFFLARAAWVRWGSPHGSPPSVAALAGFLAALLYSALADFAIPTQRALIMIGVAMGAVILRRPLDAPHALAVALLAVVLYDPPAVLAPGFWLSFGAVALIAFTLSGRLGRLSGWQALLKINGATALGLAPLLLLFFQQVSIVSPLANFLAVPILGTLMIPLCLAGAVLLTIHPPSGAWLLHLAAAILDGTWPILEYLAAGPLAQWTHAAPPPWTLPFALAGVLLLLVPRGIPGRWLGLVLLLPAVTWEPERPPPGGFRLALLDVGQGLAAVVETRGRTLVFDAGARFGPNFDMGGAVIEPYLRWRGLGHVDRLVVSHGDNDHIGGARTLLRRFAVGRLSTSVPEQLPEFAPEPCRAGERWWWDGVEFRMLGPVARLDKENDNSCVLRVRGRGGSALLTGDIERAAESLLVERYGDGLASDLLVVPHHGSKTSSTRDFLAQVRPRYALIPAGPLNRFGFPHPSVVRRYRNRGATVLGTAESGAILVDAGNGTDELRIERYRSSHRRYWNSGG